MEQVLEKVHGEGRCCMAIHPSSEYVCIGGCDGFIKQYSYGLSKKSLSVSNAMDSSCQYHDDAIHEICFCESGDYFAICCEDGEAVLFRHPDCSVCSVLCKYDCAVSSISFLPATHSFLLAMSSDHGTIKIINALDYKTNHFEFKCCDDGIRNIKFIPFAPDPFSTSREKYLAVAQCNGTLSLWKLFKTAIFDANVQEMNEKVIRTRQFTEVFPKIKGGDDNQRLEFDSTKDGHLIAIPGNTNIKLLDTKQMQFMDTNHCMTHRFAVNCCAFNHFLESADSKEYVLASSDIGGNVFIWRICTDGFECGRMDDIPAGEAPICSVVWKSATELLISNTNSDVYKYAFESTVNNETAADKKEAEAVDVINKINKKKSDSDIDSEEDFDIDMDDNIDGASASPSKKVLQRSFEDSDEDPLKAELAAAAEMFGDLNDDDDDACAPITAQNDEDDGDINEDMSVFEDKYINDEDPSDIKKRDSLLSPPAVFAHEPFVNGQTLYDADGQRYLLFNKIGAVMVRKQDVSSNAMEMSSIMNSLHHGKYCVEIDFFDKSQYSRAVTIKSDHHFICCDMNAVGLLLGSQPCDTEDGEDMKESIVRYKPIARNGEYRSFCSEKDCEWNHRLPMGETCSAVGLTHKYALIATNKRFLRILSIGGLQVKQVISLPKNVVHMAGNSDCNVIAITFDDLSLWILDLNENKKVYDGYCAVTHHTSCVIRVFMISNTQVVTVDSEHVVRVLCKDQFDWNWMAVLDIHQYLSTKYPESEVATERPKGIWPVYFDGDEQCLMVMELKHLDYPIPSQTNGSCVLMNYKLCAPLMGVGRDEVDPMTHEPITRFANREEAIMTQSLLHQLEDTSEHTAKQHKKQLLKEYITLFNHACKLNKCVLAYDIALHCLDSEKALSNAIKVAMHHELPLLAEQLTNLTKQRMRNDNSNVNRNNNVKKPTRMLRRPTAKLQLSRNRKPLQNNQNEVNDVTASMQHAKLTGKKRATNPCAHDSPIECQPSAKKPKRNPFSCHTRSENDKKNNNSIFSV